MHPISSMASIAVIFGLFQLLAQFGCINAKSGTVGLGGHNLKDGRVELYQYSKVVDISTLEAYRASLGDKGCNISFDFETPNIVLSYNKAIGCTVDLLTNQENDISFVARLEGEEPALRECLKDVDSSTDVYNNLPFMYRLTQDEFDGLDMGKHENATKCGDDGDCKDTRCKQSEIVWRKADNNVTASVSRGAGSLNVHYSEINKRREVLTFNVAVTDQTECQDEPKNWEITANNPKPEMKYLLVFHLLPQTSGRMASQKEELECNTFGITFDIKDYAILMRGEPPPPTALPTTTQTTTKTNIKSTNEANKTTTKAPVTKKKGGGSILKWLLIVGGLLVLLAVGGAVGYFFVYKKMYAKEAEGKEDKEKGEEKKDGEGGEPKKDETAKPSLCLR
ncbi:hypothetical protein ACQ4LE_007964 [Meloidogyne hapla]